jgi:hypothetical protein
MSLLEPLDEMVTTTVYRLMWKWAWNVATESSCSYVEIISATTAWLQNHMWGSPVRYVLYRKANHQLLYEWDIESGDYIKMSSIYGVKEFAARWDPLVGRLNGLIAGEPGYVDYIEYEVSAGWERWVYTKYYDDVSSNTTHILIAFDDELMALQCKLTVS